MEWNIVLMGPVGAGKSRAIRSVSDSELVDTPVQPKADGMWSGVDSKVSMGSLQLPGADRLKLYSLPGLDQFDFTWDVLLQQSHGVVLLLNHAGKRPLADLDHFVDAIRTRTSAAELPLVIGVTHQEANPHLPLSIYTQHILTRRILACGVAPPVFALDTRHRGQVHGLVLTLLAQMEMLARYPKLAPLALAR